MSQQMEPMFKDKNFGNAYSHYIHLKEALIASQSDEAKEAAKKLQSSLASVKESKAVQSEAVKTAEATSLDDHRKAFAFLSHEMTTLVKANTLSMGEVYLERSGINPRINTTHSSTGTINLFYCGQTNLNI